VNAWALLVVSSDGQSDTLDHQRESLLPIATANGWTIVQEVCEVSSGKDDARRVVRALLSELRAAPMRPDWLIMTRLDRLGRNALECQIVLRDIRALGVRVWTRLSGEAKGDKAMERFVSAVELYVAEQENEVKRDKLLANYKRKREAGMAVGNKRPYGLAIGPDGKDVPVEDQAIAVRTMFEMRAQGVGLERIANHLRAVAPPQRYKRAGEHTMRWSKHLVKNLLSNRAYVGTIVDEVTFRRVHQINTEMSRFDRPTRRHPWPLSGSLRCYCGWALVGKASGSKGANRYYKCNSVWNHDGRPRYVRADLVEQQFVVLLQRMSGNPGLVAKTRQANLTPSSPALMERAARTLRSEIAACITRVERVWEIAEQGAIRPADVQPRLDAIATERAGLQARLDDLQLQIAAAAEASRRTADVVVVLKHSEETYAESSVEDQQRIVRTVSIALGGLCSEADGTLTARRPVDAGSRVRPRLAKSR
jgi:DNA invertase Pin-like site-specific DNA recombinase